ncbi:MAG TPA: menaquinone biosynthesis protein [Nitrospirota bacterium]|nr:menaquinone biosynthesis protein [Nitrospirota bacterium]
MLKLGHIVYSNCYPPHAGILTRKVAFPFKLVEGIPTQLNRLLYEGGVDVSPSSSIEYAMNPGRYLLMPDLSITSKSRVMSILLESNVPIEELHDRVVALTTASATSVVLLRILLEVRYGAKPGYVLYEQGAEEPPEQAVAALTIGDLAIRKSGASKYAYRYDLGRLWHDFTGLPFVFALWQVNDRKNVHKELERLYDILIESRAYGLAHLAEIAEAETGRFNLPAPVLMEYWKLFSYELGEEERKGLLAFYGYAAEIGAIEAVTELRFWSKD